MTKNEISLDLIIKLPDDDLFFLLKDLMKAYFGRVVTDDGSYLFYNSGLNNPICLVSHIDTLRASDDVDLVFDMDNVYNKNGTLGADDRAGVFLILEAIKSCIYDKIPFPSILFTNFEEVGMIGVKQFIKDGLFNFLGCQKYTKLFVGLDAPGSELYTIYSDNPPKDLIKYMEDLIGLKRRYSNKISDVAILTEKYDIPHVNLSVGYTNNHCDNEYLCLNGLIKAFNSVVKMLKTPYEG